MCQMILSPTAQPLSRGTKMERFVQGRFIMEAKWGLTVMWMTCFTTHSSLSPSQPLLSFAFFVFLELRLLFLLSAHSTSSEATIGRTKSVNLAALLCCWDDHFWWRNYLVGGGLFSGCSTAETWYIVKELHYRPVCCICVWVCVFPYMVWPYENISKYHVI